MRRLSLLCAVALLVGVGPGAAAPLWAKNSQGQPAPPESKQELENEVWAGGKTIGGSEAQGYVAFTFDDGPNLETTPKILETLEKFRIPAAFFVVGRHFVGTKDKSRAGAKLLKSMSERGFVIGNHTSQHHRLDKQSPALAAAAIQNNAVALAALLGYEPKLFRPPFGAMTAKVRRLLRKRQDTTVRWNIDPQDFVRAQRKSLRARVVNRILEREGGVVLLHDTKVWTAAALPGILEDLEEANCLRIRAGQKPIVPVSLHYFMRDPDGQPRPIPSEVLKTTQETIESLTDRCQKDN